ncbi:hypothetical protein JIN85_03105 [Luteolibacter pohnpeiensis]|uniref:AsmA-like C-terminal domain-containing protein n=1 Tax=Luteolibacter pohnpeiensis TaxID=454153 RepID=A0A934S2Z9_9BACT|nr:hypothetical protein [Luteolibacter pohnpeiensis]MBK1881387.1 hypothetical protein [Luteolibacter pohnpeiensis]
MSRRSRKRNRANAPSIGWLGKSLIASSVLIMVSLAVAHLALRKYLHSESFRVFLSSKVSSALKVTGGFAPLRWDGLAVDTQSFTGKGESTIQNINLEGLHTEITFDGITRGVWELQGTRVDRVAIDIDPSRKPESTKHSPPSSKPKTKEEKSHLLPDRVEVSQLNIGDLRAKIAMEDGIATANGLQIELEGKPRSNSKTAYTAHIQGGIIALPGDKYPDIAIDHLDLKSSDDSVFVTSALARVWKSGSIQFTGEYHIPDKSHVFEGELSHVQCDELFKDDWARRLSGEVHSTFVAEGRSAHPYLKGHLSIQNGKLTALPVLDALAAYADTRRFRELILSEAHTDWKKDANGITLNNLVLESEGLMHLQGDLNIHDEKLDGLFRLGLAPGTLSTIPGAETTVFQPGEKGLLWTTLRITGTTKKPKEDLTNRLIAAAGLRMFELAPETGEKVLRFTQSIVDENSSETLQKGVDQIGKGIEIIEKSTDAVRDAGTLLNGLFGDRRKDQ